MSRLKRIAAKAAPTTLILTLGAYADPQPVGDTPTRATTPNGHYISWREHIIDDTEIAGFPLSGSDGLVMGDIDNDGSEDIVSVHESDVQYDGTPDGHVRIAFGSGDPQRWHSITLSEGTEAGAPEDASIADVNGDGYPDVMVASELAHLVYFQNPGRDTRTVPWQRLILPVTRNRGSYIRVFLADFNGDGQPEAVAPNKGAQNPEAGDFEKRTPVSVFSFEDNPLGDWQERELGRYSVPQNSEPVDIDADGDLDIVGGSRGERRIFIFENVSGPEPGFREWRVDIDSTMTAGFNMDYADFNGDGRLDIVSATPEGLAWLAQPQELSGVWKAHPIGSFGPDLMTAIVVADIDSDGDPDVLSGSYSRGPRDRDGDVGLNTPLGRLGWFANPGSPGKPWVRHDISRRKRGMFDKFISRDLDGDGDIDFVGTRGNSDPYDGVFWLEQVRTVTPSRSFVPARTDESEEVSLP